MSLSASRKRSSQPRGPTLPQRGSSQVLLCSGLWPQAHCTALHLFHINSLTKYLLSIWYVPGTMLTEQNRQNFLASHSWEGTRMIRNKHDNWDRVWYVGMGEALWLNKEKKGELRGSVNLSGKKTFGQLLEGNVQWARQIFSRKAFQAPGHSQYKGPEARMCLMWLESSEEDKVTKQSGKGRKGTGYDQRDQEAQAGLAVYC